MKIAFDRLYRGFLVFWLLLVVFAVWSGAQTNNPPPEAQIPAQTQTAIKEANKFVFLNQQVSLSFGLDRVSFLQPPLFGNPLWKYLASLIFIGLAFLTAKLLDLVFRAWLKKLTAKTKTQLDDILLDLLDGPVKVIVFVILLHVGLDIFSWPAWLQSYLSKGLKLVVAGSLTYLALRSVNLLMNYWQARLAGGTDHAFNDLMYPILTKTLKVFVVVVAILVTSQNLGLNITGVLASLSIGGLALGLAAQDTLANLFGAVAVFLDKPFRIGDRIKLDPGVDGIVETIGLRSTRVRNLDGHLITIPNKTMGGATITNIALRPNIKTEINFGLTYDTSLEKLRRALDILREIYRGHPMTHDVTIAFNKFTDSALNIQVVHWWKNTDYNAYMAGMQEMNLAIKQRFEAEGIDFAFPSQTVYIKPPSP